MKMQSAPMFSTTLLQSLAGAMLALMLVACASTGTFTQGGKGKQPGRKDTVTCPPATSCPQNDCSRTLTADERKTSGLGYALYYDLDGNMMFGEDLSQTQCRVVSISIIPEPPVCPTNKPWVCGTSPNTYCSSVKYPGCR
jgi:hypothetical protein